MFRIKLRVSISCVACDATQLSAIMPLTLAELEEIQADAMADDIDIDFATMSLWTREKAIKFFEGGGVEEKTFTPLPKLSKPKAVDKAAWLKTQSKNTKGDTYGIEFPHTFGQLSTYGASWFTKAFRLAGTLSEDNAVEELVDISRCLGGGAAEKAFVTVRYKKDEPGLHTRLFAKFPHETNVDHKFFISSQECDEPEVRWAQKLAHKGPVAAPKTYFAEYSKASTNYLLITERIEFASEETHPRGKAGRDVPLAPNAIERVYDKFMDHLIGSDPLEYYLCLANAIGKQIGWYKADNDAGSVLNSSFPFAPPPPPASAVHPMSPMLIDFATTTCKCLFADDVSDPKYQQQLQSEMKELAPMLGKAYKYLLSDPDYLGYAHPNGNIDNFLVEGRGGQAPLRSDRFWWIRLLECCDSLIKRVNVGGAEAACGAHGDDAKSVY